MWDHIDATDASTTVIAMIEDPEALDQIDAIAGVQGIDGFFIGRGDLTVAFEAESWNAPEVRAAVLRIADAVSAHGKTLCALVGGDDAAWLKEIGVSAFIVSSDQGPHAASCRAGALRDGDCRWRSPMMAGANLIGVTPKKVRRRAWL